MVQEPTVTVERSPEQPAYVTQGFFPIEGEDTHTFRFRIADEQHEFFGALGSTIWGARYDPKNTIVTGSEADALKDYRERRGGMSRIENFQLDQARFSEAMKLLDPAERTRIYHALSGLLHIDFRHSASTIIECFCNPDTYDLWASNLNYMYDESGESGSSYDNFRASLDRLKTADKLPGYELAKEIHEIMATGGIEEVDVALNGSVRTHSAGPDLPESMSRSEYRALASSPYLTWVPKEGGIFTEKGYSRVDQRYHGEVMYPCAEWVKEEALHLIRDTDPRLVSEIEAYQALDEDERASFPEDEFARLTSELLSALEEQRDKEFLPQAAQALKAETPEELYMAIKLFAVEARKRVHLHSFSDLNGRTTRATYLYGPLNQLGVSRPWLKDPDADMMAAEGTWINHVMRGIVATDTVFLDIAERVTLGLDPQLSPYLLHPHTLTRALVPQRRIVSNEVREDPDATGLLFGPIDSAQFGAYLESVLRNASDNLLARLEGDYPDSVVDELRADYKEFRTATRVLYKRKKGDDPKLVEMSLADLDFIRQYGEIWAIETERWEAKMKRWFTPRIIARGQPYEVLDSSDDTAMDFFVSPGAAGIAENSGGIFDQDPTSEHIVEAVQDELYRANDAIRTGEIWNLATDHQTEGELYDNSVGCSSSRLGAVAATFAMGFYNFPPKIEDCIKEAEKNGARVVLFGYEAKHDLDLNTRRALDPGSRSKFGLQAETLVLGGWDPDAVMGVIFLGADTVPEVTYVRNPKNPSEILVIEGPRNPTKESLEELLARPNRRLSIHDYVE